MKTPVDSLVRVSSWKLDEAQQKLSDLQTLEKKLIQDLEKLDRDVQHEQDFATKNPEMAHTYPVYAEAARERRQRIVYSIEEIIGWKDQAQQELQSIYQELKKYEEAQANDIRRQKEVLRKKEQAAFDEMGIQLYRRRKSSEN
ncbi:hypothetical protein O4H49_07075 [Kiloniella laminariae]|uniref:Flagellar FliJ protein n=1 Tax=Kiloniella laminariae TaxID=454162 RepID=A0ABT4LHF1_9PROT|nr:hypothetical protein [Kiloniella laminariae]MCZ4280533.1 hypothetical protein [Kiloniella laminariae]